MTTERDCKHGQLARSCNVCELEAEVAQQAAEIERLHDYDTKLSAVMPADYKDWHEGSKKEWPELAAESIKMWRDRANEAYVEIERLEKANNAFALLAKSQEERISTLFKSKSKYEEATATLQSERDANATLTAEIERLEAERERNLDSIQIGNNVINRKNSELDKANALLRQASELLYRQWSCSAVWSLEEAQDLDAAIKQHLGDV